MKMTFQSALAFAVGIVITAGPVAVAVTHLPTTGVALAIGTCLIATVGAIRRVWQSDWPTALFLASCVAAPSALAGFVGPQSVAALSAFNGWATLITIGLHALLIGLAIWVAVPHTDAAVQCIRDRDGW